MARAEAYLHAKFHLDPSNRLATIGYTNVTDRQDRQDRTDKQRSDSIGEPFFAIGLCYIARPSVVCRLSVTFVRPIQAVKIFGNISTALCTLAIHRPRGTPPPGELKTGGVAKYSDFGPIDGYLGNGAK